MATATSNTVRPGHMEMQSLPVTDCPITVLGVTLSARISTRVIGFFFILAVTPSGLRMCSLRPGAQSSFFSGLPFEVSSDAEDVRYAVVALVTCVLKHHLIRPNHWDFRGPGVRP